MTNTDIDYCEICHKLEKPKAYIGVSDTDGDEIISGPLCQTCLNFLKKING